MRALASRPPPPAPEPPVRFQLAPGQGLSVATTDGRFSASVRGRIQVRNALQALPTGAVSDDFGIRTLRVQLAGNVLVPDLRYFLHLALGAADFEANNPSPLYDAWVEYTGLRDLHVRVGQLLVPLDRARTLREFGLQFVDRPNVVREFSLDRDVGVQLWSHNLFNTRWLGYQLFLGAGDGRNRVGTGAPLGPLVVARLQLRPWGVFDEDTEGDLTRERRPRLLLGVGGAYNVNSNRAQSTFGAVYTLGTTNYWHGAADLLFKYAGFSLMAEGLLRRATVDHMDQGTQREWTRSGWGYFVQAGVMAHRMVELTARWEQLGAFAGTDPTLQQLVDQQGHQVGGGLNVYLNGHLLKLQTDYFFLWGNDAAAGRHSFRLQLDASF